MRNMSALRKPTWANLMKTEYKNDELTTCHVIARNSSNRPDRGGGFLDIVAHAHAGAIALRDIVDEEVGERSMSASYLGSSGD